MFEIQKNLNINFSLHLVICFILELIFYLIKQYCPLNHHLENQEKWLFPDLFSPSLSPRSKYLEQINTITSNETDMALLENRQIPSLEIGKNIAAM